MKKCGPLIFTQVFSIIIVICIATPIFLAALVPMGIFYYYAQIYYGKGLIDVT